MEKRIIDLEIKYTEVLRRISVLEIQLAELKGIEVFSAEKCQDDLPEDHFLNRPQAYEREKKTTPAPVPQAVASSHWMRHGR